MSRVTCRRLPPSIAGPSAPSPAPPSLKQAGAEAFARADYTLATRLYTLALRKSGPSADLYGNRSASHAACGAWADALADAMLMRHATNNDVLRLKAAYRAARACNALGMRADARRACAEGLAIRPGHPQLTRELEAAGPSDATDAPPSSPSDDAPLRVRLKVGRCRAVDVDLPHLSETENVSAANRAALTFLAEMGHVDDPARARLVVRGKVLTEHTALDAIRAAAAASPAGRAPVQVIGSPQRVLDEAAWVSEEIEARLGLG